ncbi:HEAT repeat domain-containing protein [Pseudomonas xanthosomatis]|uniref:HEAT repeat domain-containing protein n=1 Tax=Pseudomonas xanthosomatis TaxID=2842356 RepID=UPI003516D47C
MKADQCGQGSMDEKIIKEFLRWIGETECSGWNEYYSEQVAKGLLPKFSSAEWIWLEQHIKTQPDYWVQRCVAALGDSRAPEGIPILKALLSSSNFDTQIMAASELDWSEAPIEEEYFSTVENILFRLPNEDHHLYPEIINLLKKSNPAQH